MRIAIIQGAFFPVPTTKGGAVEKMWFALGNEFANRGHEVVEISRLTDGLLEDELLQGVQHIRIKGFDTPKSGIVLKAFDLLYTLRTRKLFLADFDIVVSNTFWAPIILPQKAQKICVVDVQRMPKGQMQLYTHVSRLRANSTPVAIAIKNELPQSKHDKVILIPNPLPFIPKYEIEFTKKQPIILYVGRIHPEKGLDLLIKAFKQTSQTYRLQLVGPWGVSFGGGGMDYINSLRQLADGASVEFIGPVFDMEALNKLYIDSSIFVYPSIAEKGETFGLAPLEAMAWGCVPIVSNLSCFQDFIHDGENGFIFDHRAQDATHQLAKHITYLQENDEMRIALARRTLAVRQTHSIHHIADLFLEEFLRIMEQTKRNYAS